MASYAPLFVHVNDRKWNPDAIGFDATRSFGTPSYYVQKLFAEHRPDAGLPVSLAAPAPAPKTLAQIEAARAGVVGVGTWRTRAEFKEIGVTRADGTTVALPAPGSPRGWRAGSGTWTAENGVVRQTGDGEDTRYVAALPAETFGGDYTLTLKARKLGGDEGFLILFRVRGEDDWYWWNLGGWRNVRHAVQRASGGAGEIIGGEAAGSIETGRWYDIKVEAKGRRIRCYLDGALVHDFDDPDAPTPATLFATAGRIGKDGESGEFLVKVVNSADAPQTTDFRLDGWAGGGVPEASVTVLTGPSNTAENTLDAPETVAPISLAPVRGAVAPDGAATLRMTLAPRSLTILRVRRAGGGARAARVAVQSAK
jgi:hypothetical protein